MRRRSRSRWSTPSPLRVEAPCAHYPACGGCRFQDLAYEAQVAAKEEQVADALRRIGGIAEPPLEPIVPASRGLPLPQQARVLVHATPAGPALGFHRAGRWDEVLEIERCWLTTDLGNAIRNAVRDWARAEGSRPTTRRSTPATCATSSCARAATRGRCSSSSSPRRASASTATSSSRCSAASRRCGRSTGR